MRLTNLALSSTLLLSLVACRGSDNNNGDDVQPMPDATVPGGEVTIMEVQNDAMPVGTQVTVKGVVVTAIDSFGNRTGDFFVQDPAGGPFSGVKVFGAPLDQVATLAVGDVIDISNAEKDEFALTDDMSGRKVTELKPAAGGMMLITKKGTGNVPAPATVDALAISQMPAAQQDGEWEKWEGVLITVTNARQLTDITNFNRNAPGPDTLEFEITGGVAVQTVLAEFPTTAVAQTCYEGITGIGDYFFNYLVLPRSADDLVAGGTGCQASQVTTIGAVQAGTATGPIELADVFVAAVSFNKKNLWLTTSQTAAPNEGIYVFRGNSASVPVLDAAVVAGARVDVVGNAIEGNNDQMGDTITQITGASISVTAAPGTAATPVSGVPASTLVDATTGEPYESVLVSLTGVKVVSVGDSANFYVGSLQQGATTFLSDDDILRLLPADAGKCFDFVGIWTYQVFSNAFGLLPISKTEVACQ